MFTFLRVILSDRHSNPLTNDNHSKIYLELIGLDQHLLITRTYKAGLSLTETDFSRILRIEVNQFLELDFTTLKLNTHQI